MNVTVKDRYMVFPVRNGGEARELSFYLGDERVYRLDVRYDRENPDFYAFCDVSRFIGKELRLETGLDGEAEYRFAHEIDSEGLYSEPYRPRAHFSPKNGWMNDPNGLIFDGGKYHAFFQYNPCDVKWGNMHWGHAVSEDLVHWEEKDIALFPTEDGMQFSGSAVKADRVKGGFFGDKRDALCLFHTMTNPFSQWLSYSIDGFETVKTYGCVVPNVTQGNRDPKVVFCDELDSYVMVFYLVEDRYAIYVSDNLTEWTRLQEVRVKGDCECPDLIPLVNDLGERKWVLIGAHDKYLTGTVENGIFVFSGEPKTLHFGTASYAGQTFAGVAPRTVRMVWDRGFNDYPRTTQQMGVPMELYLKKINGEDTLCLTPVAEFDLLIDRAEEFRDVSNLCAPLDTDCAYLVKIGGKKPAAGAAFASVFGIEFKLDFSENKLIFSDLSMPLSADGNLNLTVVTDKNSIEFFEESAYLTVSDYRTVYAQGKAEFTLKADGGASIGSVKVAKLKSILE